MPWPLGYAASHTSARTYPARTHVHTRSHTCAHTYTHYTHIYTYAYTAYTCTYTIATAKSLATTKWSLQPSAALGAWALLRHYEPVLANTWERASILQVGLYHAQGDGVGTQSPTHAHAHTPVLGGCSVGAAAGGGGVGSFTSGISSTKLLGKTPSLLPTLPFHHPSSTTSNMITSSPSASCNSSSASGW